MAGLKELLKNKLSKSELQHLRRAYDTIGSITVVEIPPELVKKQKIIAQTIIENNKHIISVYKKTGKRTKICRIPRLIHIAGPKNTETICIENNVRLKTDIAKAYFSHRLATERKRIFSQVKRGERVLIMFSGVGPYTLSIAKNTKAKEIIGVEKNPTAHKFAETNKTLNKVSNVKNYRGDVRKIIPSLGKFDRIIMPLPKGAEPFLNTALQAAKKGTTIHFYDFLHENDIPKVAVDKVKSACAKSEKKCRILKTVRCGQLGPRQYRVSVDFRIL